MKKPFCALLALLFCFSALGGCASSGTPKIPVSFTVVRNSVTPGGLTYRVIGLPGIWEYGEDFVLERREDGEWTAVRMLLPETAVFFPSIAYFGVYGKKQVDWTWLYGELSEGRYRIGKTFGRKGKTE